MATLTTRHGDLIQHREPSHRLSSAATVETAEPLQRQSRQPSPEIIEQRAHAAGVKTVVLIIAGVALVCFLIALFTYGWKLAGLCTVGLTLYSLIFGGPFWLAAIDSEVERERTRWEDRPGAH